MDNYIAIWYLVYVKENVDYCKCNVKYNKEYCLIPKVDRLLNPNLTSYSAEPPYNFTRVRLKYKNTDVDIYNIYLTSPNAYH